MPIFAAEKRLDADRRYPQSDRAVLRFGRLGPLFSLTVRRGAVSLCQKECSLPGLSV